MKLTKLDHIIIERVKEYLPKEFGVGLLWRNIYTEDKIEIVVSEMRGGNFHSLIYGFEVHFPHSSQIKEIIGQYCLSGLLKYVYKVGGDLERWYDEEYFYVYGCEGYTNTPNGEDCLDSFEFKFPNLPTYLWSEEEKQNFIDLTDNIGKYW